MAAYAKSQADSKTIEETGSLTYFEGDVSINDTPGEIGDVINNDDTITTGENSYCEVIFGQANIFRLEENTTTRINWKNSDINVKKGTIAVVFSKLDKFLHDDKDFTVSTPSAVAGVRGTVFFVKIENENKTYLCICNGELNINNVDNGLNIGAGHHKAYRFIKEGNKIITESAPLIYHDDKKVEMLAAKIDYTIPWNDKVYNSY
ncbi:MAG: FecR family protein [Spirochaetaceae bacterium]|nr:FecR family protein [Spirochaetaceae bacterium]